MNTGEYGYTCVHNVPYTDEWKLCFKNNWLIVVLIFSFMTQNGVLSARVDLHLSVVAVYEIVLSFESEQCMF